MKIQRKEVPKISQKKLRIKDTFASDVHSRDDLISPQLDRRLKRADYREESTIPSFFSFFS